ncbi:unnamed protein product [Symbiodinium sp. CCMP2592]|nr:unnamed protein product [Symbiodinium sp. CCMP2592]
MGSMDRLSSIVAFADKLHIFSCDSDSFAEAFGGDAEQQKFYECRRWCMALASKRKTHFGESHVRGIVAKNLQALLRNCMSAGSVARDAMYVVMNYACDALPSLQRPIAETVLSRMEALVESDIAANPGQIGDCITSLTMVLRSMNKPQRQKWASLLVKLLMDSHVREDELIWRLNMLWLADDNPRETYAEARQQVRTFANSASEDLQAHLQYLIHSG